MTPERLDIILNATALNTHPFAAVMFAADETAKRYAKRRGDRCNYTLVIGSAGFEAAKRASEDACSLCEFMDTVAACEAHARKACR